VARDMGQEEPASHSLPAPCRLLAKYGFYLSLSVFFYAVLFPFSFDISWQHLTHAWSQSIGIPYWYPETGVRILADDIANVLLTVPLGFFGSVVFGGAKGKWIVWKWCIFGFALGLAAECIQLAIPARATVVTDSINNGIGAFLGCAVASVIGNRMLLFFTGAALERRNIYLWLVIWSLAALAGPYDLSSDSLLRMDSGIWTIRPNAPRPEMQAGDLWIRMAGFLIVGALASRLAVPGRRKQSAKQPLAAAALVLAFPAALQCVRLLITLHEPSVLDLTLDTLAGLTGFIAALYAPGILRARSGFILFHAALLAAGLSPYRFSSLEAAPSFQWMPFYEFCANRTPSALYETTLSLVGFAILGGFLSLSFPRLHGRRAAFYALVFSGAIELAQTFLPARTAGTTDILTAVLGAWIGAYICTAVESSRRPDARLNFSYFW